MLRVALRRIVWLIPTLLVATIVAFWALSGVAADASSHLPLFLNLHPLDLRDRTNLAVAELARGGPGAKAAERQLLELGGATLPHLLPRLDSLSPSARAQVAQALTPLARRMGIAAADSLDSRESVALFWQRYWNDHGVDFRPAIVKRAVRRYAERPTQLRRAEVLRFDTFALPELIDQLRQAASTQESARITRLISMLEHMTQSSRDSPRATLDASQSLEQWLTWWAEHRAQFVTFTGVGRVAAMVRETRYGRWAAELARGGLGRLPDGASVASVFRERVTTTGWLLAVALGAGYPLGIFACALVAARRSRGSGRLFDAFAIGAIAIPPAVLATVIAAGSTIGALLPATLLTAIVSAATSSRHFRTVHRAWAASPYTQAARARGLTDTRVVWLAARPAAAATFVVAAADVPVALTLAFVVEQAFRLQGLGSVTVLAVQAGNLPWLMVLSISSVIATGCCQIGSDAIAGMLDPRSAYDRSTELL